MVSADFVIFSPSLPILDFGPLSDDWFHFTHISLDRWLSSVPSYIPRFSFIRVPPKQEEMLTAILPFLAFLKTMQLLQSCPLAMSLKYCRQF